MANRVSWSLAAGVLSILMGSAARADDQPEWQAKSKLDYTRGNVTSYCPLDKRPDDLARCKSELTAARRVLDGIAANNRNMPLYREVVDYVEKASARVPGWEKSMSDEKAGDDERRRLRKEFADDAEPYERALLALAAARSPDREKYRYMKATDLDELIVAGEKLAGLAALCEGKYKGKQIDSFAREDSPSHPKNACDMASSWKQHVGRLAVLVAGERAALVTANLESGLVQLEAKGALYDNDLAAYADSKGFIAKERKAFEPSFAKLGVELPPELFGEIDAIAKRYPETVKKAAAEDRWPAGSKHHDGAAEKPIAAAVTGAGFKVVKSGLVAPDWEIVKNDIGLPLKKIRTASVAVRAKGESFCRIYQVTAVADYSGGGKYTKPRADFDPVQQGAIVTRCP